MYVIKQNFQRIDLHSSIKHLRTIFNKQMLIILIGMNFEPVSLIVNLDYLQIVCYILNLNVNITYPVDRFRHLTELWIVTFMNQVTFHCVLLVSSFQVVL